MSNLDATNTIGDVGTERPQQLCQEQQLNHHHHHNHRQPTFNELLIQEVQCHPELYDQQHRVCTDNGERNMIWEVIAGRIDDSVTGEFAKKRWLQMRDRYRKELKMALRNMVQPKWPYFKKLSWLDPYLKDTKSTSLSSTPGSSALFSGVGADVESGCGRTSTESFDFADFLPYSAGISANALLENIMAASNALIESEKKKRCTTAVSTPPFSATAHADSALLRDVRCDGSVNNNNNNTIITCQQQNIASLRSLILDHSVNYHSPDSAIASTSEDGGDAATTASISYQHNQHPSSDLPKFLDVAVQHNAEVMGVPATTTSSGSDYQEVKGSANKTATTEEAESRRSASSVSPPPSSASVASSSAAGPPFNNNENVEDDDDDDVSCKLEVDDGESPNNNNADRETVNKTMLLNTSERQSETQGDRSQAFDSGGGAERSSVFPQRSLTSFNFADLMLRGAAAVAVAANNSGSCIGKSAKEHTPQSRPRANRNPPYLVRRGGGVRVRNSAFSLVNHHHHSNNNMPSSVAVIDNACNGRSFSSTPTITQTTNASVGEAFVRNILFPHALPLAAANSSNLTSQTDELGPPSLSAPDSASLLNKHLRSIKQSLSRSTSMNTTTLPTVTTTNGEATSSNILFGGRIASAFQEDDVFLSTVVPALSETSQTAMTTVRDNNHGLQWMNQLQTLTRCFSLAASSSTSNGVCRGNISDNDAAVTSSKRIKTNDETADESRPNGGGCGDGGPGSALEWINDEDLLFARLIVVRLKKFSAKDRRLIRAKINDCIDVKEEELEAEPLE